MASAVEQSQQANQSIKGCFSACSADGQRLANEEECSAFMHMLITHGHVLDSDMPVLQRLCVAPITHGDLVQRLVAEYASSHTRAIETIFRALFQSVDDVHKLLDFWHWTELGEKQTAQLLVLLEQLCGENEAALAALADWRTQLDARYGDEDLASLFWDKLAVRREAVLSAHEYQRAMRPRISEVARERRVDRVYTPVHEAVVVLGQTAIGTRTVGLDLTRDFKVEVLTVPLPCTQAAAMRALLNEIEALRQLALSPHFACYRGCDDTSAPDRVQYFFDLVPRATPLVKLVHKYGSLDSTSLLLQHWSHQALCAFRDVLGKCTLRVAAPITLQNLFVADDGARVLLRNVEWLGERPHEDPAAPAERSYVKTLEAQLVLTFGQLLYFLLTATEPQLTGTTTGLPPMPLEPFLRGILRTCLVATRRPTVGDLLCHPFFASAAQFEDDAVKQAFAAKLAL